MYCTKICQLKLLRRLSGTRNEYSISWTEEQLAALEDDVRPTRTLNAAEAYVISKNERPLNKKLAWACETEETRKLRDDDDRAQSVRWHQQRQSR